MALLHSILLLSLSKCSLITVCLYLLKSCLLGGWRQVRVTLLSRWWPFGRSPLQIQAVPALLLWPHTASHQVPLTVTHHTVFACLSLPVEVLTVPRQAEPSGQSHGDFSTCRFYMRFLLSKNPFRWHHESSHGGFLRFRKSFFTYYGELWILSLALGLHEPQLPPQLGILTPNCSLSQGLHCSPPCRCSLPQQLAQLYPASRQAQQGGSDGPGCIWPTSNHQDKWSGKGEFILHLEVRSEAEVSFSLLHPSVKLKIAAWRQFWFCCSATAWAFSTSLAAKMSSAVEMNELCIFLGNRSQRGVWTSDITH